MVNAAYLSDYIIGIVLLVNIIIIIIIIILPIVNNGSRTKWSPIQSVTHMSDYDL